MDYFNDPTNAQAILVSKGSLVMYLKKIIDQLPEDATMWPDNFIVNFELTVEDIKKMIADYEAETNKSIHVTENQKTFSKVTADSASVSLEQVDDAEWLIEIKTVDELFSGWFGRHGFNPAYARFTKERIR